MLELIHRYARGYVAVPVIIACKEKGFFQLLKKEGPLAFEQLVQRLRANEGYLKIALKMFQSLQWVSFSNGVYTIGVKSGLHRLFPKAILDLYHFPMDAYLTNRKQRRRLAKWIDLSQEKWKVSDPMIADFLDGVLLLPLFIGLKRNKILEDDPDEKDDLFARLNPSVRNEVCRLFMAKGWAVKKGGRITLTHSGRLLIDHALIVRETVSYTPLLTRIRELLFGDVRSVFAKDEIENVEHVDRILSSAVGGVRQERYFPDVKEILLSVFNRLPFEQQPKYVATMGCGDGSLIKSIYEVIRDQSERGKALSQFPVRMIGFSCNIHALEVAENSLTKGKIPFTLLQGDLKDPGQMLKGLNAFGIEDNDQILYIRSFIDHHEPLLAPSDEDAVFVVDEFKDHGDNVNQKGGTIVSGSVYQTLAVDMRRWASVIAKHGLIALEIHSWPSDIVRNCLSQMDGHHFDDNHSFSGQNLVQAEVFLLAAAKAGLFPKHGFPKRYPNDLGICRNTLIHFESREYKIRCAEEKDFPSLQRLERECWPSGLRTSASKLRKRLNQYPNGQLVLELDKEVVGVVYSQRIAKLEDIETISYITVDTLYEEAGSVVQLLSLNILPEFQHRCLGDQLLEFMLQYCGVMEGVDAVVGVTLCKTYHIQNENPLKDYIHKRDVHGHLVDPILRFHELHGARVERLVPGYRPKDKKNEGCGVLVYYDIRCRKRDDLQIRKSAKGEGLRIEHQSMLQDNSAEKIKDFVEDAIKTCLGPEKEEAYSKKRPLMEMGLDSADLLTLNEQICYRYHIDLEPSFFFQFNTVERILFYLEEQLLSQENDSDFKPNSLTTQLPQTIEALPKGSIGEKNNESMKTQTGIAIIGTACRLPGGITTPEALWEFLKAGKDAIEELPRGRWIWPPTIDPDHHPGIEYGGFLKEIGCFDASLFRLSPKEVELMDPQQRILLELSWEVLEDAGYSVDALSNSNTGVFIGASGSDYRLVLEKYQTEVEAHFATGNSMSVMANRISYFFDFHGPSLQIDTACSSSLVAVHKAVQSLQLGECSQALVGGVNVICHPATSIAYYKAGMLSPDGCCKAFDKRANGYVRAEGAVMLLLKPLRNAILDNDHINAVIRGTACNHGGQAGGLTVPNPEHQARLIRDACKTANIRPATIGYIEAHGTGTSLGDPIEIRGLKEAFSPDSRNSTSKGASACGIGSIKTNLGHLEAAAGITGLLKVVLCLKKRELPASLNFEELNPHIDLSGSPFFVVKHHQKWPTPKDRNLRRAGVSSFGSGGANAHVVIEEYIQEGSRNVDGHSVPCDRSGSPVSPTARLKVQGSGLADKKPYLIVLSAMNEDRLKAVAKNLYSYLIEYRESSSTGQPSREQETANLHQVAHTLQVGRQAMEERLAIVAEDFDTLVQRLDDIQKGNLDSAGVYHGNLKRNSGNSDLLFSGKAGEQFIQTLLEERDLQRLGHLWISNDVNIDWNLLYKKTSPRRISLPTYPFAKERYWVCETGDHESRFTNGKKEINSAERIETLIFRPVWKAVEVSNTAASSEFSQQLVMLCEMDSFSPEQGGFAQNAANITWLWLKSEGNDLAKRYQDISIQVFESIKAILKKKPKGKILVQILVRDQGIEGLFCGLSGILKTAHLENQKILGQIILVDSNENEKGLLRVIEENSRHPEDAHIRYVKNTRQVFSWAEVSASVEVGQAPWKEGGVYLISGGAGGLGLIFANEIARKTKDTTLILIGRSSLSREKQDQIKVLKKLDAKVEYREVDVSQQSAVKELIQSILREFGQINGILHGAGVIRDNFILKKTVQEFQEVLAPKVAGTIILDHATKDLDLDFYILFSSVSGELGNVGQSDYATSNAFMDAYARYRNPRIRFGQRRGWTLSINWPLWKEGGMRVDDVTEKLMKQILGLVAMETSHGTQALVQGLYLNQTQIMVLEGDPGKIKQRILEGKSTVETSRIKTRMLQIDKDVLREKTSFHLKRLLGETTKLPVDQIEPHEPFKSYGIDSILITQLNQKLETIFKAISKTLFFEYQTLAALTDYLIVEHPKECIAWTRLESTAFSQSAVPSPPAGADREFPALNSLESGHYSGQWSSSPYLNCRFQDSIAIIGISGHYAQANTLDEYWRILIEGKDCITEIPQDRWSLEGFFLSDPQEAIAAGKSYSKWGSFLGGFANFDPLFFSISPREAMTLDPQERLFLQCSWEVLEDAGYTRETLKQDYHQRVGVFAGITKTGFDLYGPELWKQGENIYPHTSFSSVANRISYHFNLQGPSMPIDTMCSSSLTAIHEACEYLRHKDCEMAIAGGVNLYLHPSTYFGLCASNMLARDGKCKSFGRGGSGFVPGEGVGVILLKPLSQAMEDHDHIYAVIRGSSVNHGGKTNGYTVPNPKAQAQLIRESLEKAGVNARSISYMEAHGTGTELGDPIEMTGLTQAFKEDTTDTGFCALGSAKSNLGHLEAAAGILGLTKVILQMKHKTIVPTLHAEKLNPNINFVITPFVVQQTCAKWNRPTVTLNGETKEYPRIAGISSFGAGGSNAHIIVEEYIQEGSGITVHGVSKKLGADVPLGDSTAQAGKGIMQKAEGNKGPFLIVLSAKNEERLKEASMNLHAYLTSSLTPRPVHLNEMAYTLQVGREAMEERLAIIVRSVEELVRKFKDFLNEQDGIEDLYYGQVKHNKSTLAVFRADEDMTNAIDTWVSKGKYGKLLDLWVKGLSFDWNKLYGETKPYRISLPTYPFAQEHYWFNNSKVEASNHKSSLRDPSVVENTSSLPEERFVSNITGEETFPSIHQSLDTTVIIAGAGLFGICFGYHLKQANIDFIILEKEEGVGGVWYKNTWPGCGCDIPMIAYAYSFAQYKGPVWAKQPEILNYLNDCAKNLGISDKIRLKTEVTCARYKDDSGHWEIKTQNGEILRCRFFCSATGSIGLYPKIPDLPGMADFQGPIFHAMDYQQQKPTIEENHLAVIGNGATQLQIVEAIQQRAKSLMVYARSPKYVYPRAKYNSVTEDTLSENVELWLQARREYLKNADQFYEILNDPIRLNPFKKNNEVRQFFNRIYDQPIDDYYRWCEVEGFIPTYAPGCNRPLISDTYHQRIRKPNVEVILSKNLRIKKDGIESESGFRKCDSILLCTGYDLNDFRVRYPIYGRDGLSLAEHYASDNPKTFFAYHHGFPNLMVVPCPNTGTNATSITAMYENLCENLVKNLRYCNEHDCSTFNIRYSKVREFAEFIHRSNRDGSFSSNCNSWYKNKAGENIAIFPGKFSTFQAMAAFDPSQFDYEGRGYSFDPNHVNKKRPRSFDHNKKDTRDAKSLEQTVMSRNNAFRYADKSLEEKLIQYLGNIVSDILKIPTDQIDSDVNFQEYGVDSILLIEITNHLKRDFPS